MEKFIADEDAARLVRDIMFKEDDFYDSGGVKASSLMYHFQEIAAEHAEVLGIGYGAMMANHWIWVLSKLKFKLYGEPEPGRQYSLATYPRPKKGALFNRDYYLSDGDRLLAAGISQWCIINFDTRRIERTDIDFDIKYIDHPAFDGGMERIKLDAPVFAGSHVVSDEDMDENLHTNNCRYADMIDEALGISSYSDYAISFRHETVKGDRIDIFGRQVGESVLVTGNTGDGMTAFTARVGIRADGEAREQ